MPGLTCLALSHIWALFILLLEACRLRNGVVLALNFSSSGSSCMTVSKFYKISELHLPHLQNGEMIRPDYLDWLSEKIYVKRPGQGLFLSTLETCFCLLLVIMIDFSFSVC